MQRYVNELELTEDFINQISKKPIGKDYIEPLVELNSKMEFHSNLDSNYESVKDISIDLKTLQNRAVIRLRKFLIEQFNELGVPKTNINIKQQHILQFKYFMTFLDQIEGKKDNNTMQKSYSITASLSINNGGILKIASELRNFYIDLMSKIYMGHFRSYVQSLNKYRETIIPDKSDLLAVNIVGNRSSIFATKKTNQYLHSIFHLGMHEHIY